jgi:hypothetical protein
LGKIERSGTHPGAKLGKIERSGTHPGAKLSVQEYSGMKSGEIEHSGAFRSEIG